MLKFFSKLFSGKPAPDTIIVLHDHPCPNCDLADYVKVVDHPAGDVLQCVNCGYQWRADTLFKNGYTSGKG